MANNEFKNIDEFIEGFTRTEPITDDYIYEGIIFGMEFRYKGKIYRITRDPIDNEKDIRKKFNKSDKAYIKFFEIPVELYPSMMEYNLNYHIGIYDNVDDLLDNGKIDGISLRNIIASNETEILAID